ncbi:mechanosensitive protein [Bordetella trematum]|nr:mechanosensitive protein [Bordetella trematum]
MTPLTQGWRVFLPLLMLWLALLPAPASAQPPADEAEAILSEARRQLDGLRKSLPELENDDILVKRRSEALEIQAQANAAATTLTPELAGVSARLAELGQAPEGQSEAGDVARQRAQLERDSRNLDSQLKLARLLAVEAQQTAEQISAMRREQFQASLGERRGSVLSAAFWRELKTEAPQDLQRLNDMLDKVAELINATPGRVWTMLVALVGLVLALRYWVSRRILQLTATRVPPGRLRRSLLAVTLVALSSLTPPLIAALFASGLTWEGEAAADTRALLTDLIEIAAVGGFVAGLGHALLSQRRPSWRLLPLPDDFVAGLRWLPLTLGVLVVATWAAERLPGLINASLIGTIALSNLVAALMAIVMMIALGRAERLRRRASEAPARPCGWSPWRLWPGSAWSPACWRCCRAIRRLAVSWCARRSGLWWCWPAPISWRCWSMTASAPCCAWRQAPKARRCTRGCAARPQCSCRGWAA